MSLCRCSRCENLYYSEGSEQESSCRFHPGVHRAWWSCCKEPLRGARGCRTGPHIEDAGYTAMLDSFAASAPCQIIESTTNMIIEGPDGVSLSYAEVLPDPPAMIDIPIPQVGSETASDAAAQPADGANDQLPQPTRDAPVEESAHAVGGGDTRTVAVPYVVCPHETFSSICLKHRMTSEELRQLNGLARPRARVGDVLLVWVERSDQDTNEDFHRMLVRQFRRRTGCSAAEALYYLEGHDFHLGDAIRERAHDCAFERERAACVTLILDENREERERCEASARAEAEARELATLQAAELEAAAEELRRRLNARAEAARALSACLPASAPRAGELPACLACI